MKHAWAICLTLCFFTGDPSFAQSGANSEPTGMIPSELKTLVDTAERRGNLLYIYDEAAWHGTDEFMARHKELHPDAGGYVVTGTRAEAILVFYDKAKSKALFRAIFRNGDMTNAGPPPAGTEDLTLMERRMIQARELAAKAFGANKVSICTKGRPNLAVLPPETEGGPSIAYLMSARVDLDVLPLGGHYSVTVTDDGKVGTVRKFTNSCVNLPLNVTDGKGGKLAALNITHLLDSEPTELHVFNSLTGKKPIYVMTVENRIIWKVSDGRITFVDTLQDKNR